jgi:hypothetical protein
MALPERLPMKEANGWIRPIQRQSANDLGSFMLPYLPLLAAVQDSSTSIVYIGLVTHNGAPAHDIRLVQAFSKAQDPRGNRAAREARDFYIDSKTLLVVAISDRIHFRAGPNDKGVPHEILYSNYEPKDGSMMPLMISETIHGVTEFSMTLSQVSFNSGLADSDFTW